MEDSVLRGLVFPSLFDIGEKQGSRDKYNNGNQERRTSVFSKTSAGRRSGIFNRKKQDRKGSLLPQAFRRSSKGDPFRRDFDDKLRRISHALNKTGAVDWDGNQDKEREEAKKGKEDSANNVKTSRNETDSNVTEIWRFFCQESTCHGVKNIQRRERGNIFRALWLLIVIVMTSGMTYNVLQVFVHYYEFSTMTKTDIRVNAVTSFPSVTLCNICPFKNRHGKDHPLAKIAGMTTMLADVFTLNMSDPETLAMLNSSAVEFGEQYSYTVDDLLVYAKYEEEFVSLYEDFEAVNTLFGRCFVFNGPKYIAKHGVRMANFDGRYSGLLVMANIHQDNYLVYDDMTAGLRMFVSHHPETPRLDKDGIDIHPGTSSKVEVSPVQYRFLPYPYPSYGPEFCVETDGLDLRSKMMDDSPFYSYTLCKEQCMKMNASISCGCYSALLYVEGLPPCKIENDLNCYSPLLTQYKKNKINLTCDCPRPCTSTSYTTLLSASQFPSKVTSELVLRAINETDQTVLRENYLELRVYLGSMMVRHEMHEPQYTMSYMLAYLGGQMGFFLGASLITVTELAETVVLTLFQFFKTKFLTMGQLPKSAAVRDINQP